MACIADFDEEELRLIKSVKDEMIDEELKFLYDLKNGQNHWLTYTIMKINKRILALEFKKRNGNSIEKWKISLCNSCGCMTHTKRGSIYLCGKCGKDRRRK